MIKRSFRTKLVLNFIVSVMLVMLALIAAVFFIYKPILVLDIRDNMVAYTKLTSTAYENGSTNIKRNLDMWSSSKNINSVIYGDAMEIIDYSGEYVFPESTRMMMLKNWNDIYNEEKNSDGVFFGEIEENQDMLSHAVYISEISDGVYLCMDKVVSNIDHNVNMITQIVTIGAFILIIIGTGLWYMLTRSFVIQLKKMSRVTKKMAQLDFDEKINYDNPDEVGQLADSIDGMSDELKRSINKLQQDVDRRKRLIRDISHELKTPITTVSGYTETIQLLVPDNPKVQRYCEIMIEECDVINNLIQELLYMSKLESDIECKMGNFHVDKLKDNILGRMENEFAGENITVDMYPAEIVADINLMKRALLNFITNAIKHHEKDSEIQVRGYIEGKYYVFAVTNEGKAITDEQKELIWDVFYKNDEARSRSAGGHGIGLAIVKRIADLHGGEVDLISENGKNTFYIKIRYNPQI